jgi:hypothetical protein
MLCYLLFIQTEIFAQKCGRIIVYSFQLGCNGIIDGKYVVGTRGVKFDDILEKRWFGIGGFHIILK